MAPFAGLVYAVAWLIVLVFVGRASIRLLRNPEERHRDLVSSRERLATTVAGTVLVLVGLTTLLDGPLALPYDPAAVLLPGIVLFAYPDFAPRRVT